MISAFRGRWTKLGNYSSCTVFYEGHAYPTVEHAYQAQKTEDKALQKHIREQATPALAKWLARSVPLREDWERIKLNIMRDLLLEKFSQDPERLILLSTGQEELIEGNWWHDTYWGQCPVGVGQNWLGKLLMEIRWQLQVNGQLHPPSEYWAPNDKS